MFGDRYDREDIWKDAITRRIEDLFGKAIVGATLYIGGVGHLITSFETRINDCYVYTLSDTLRSEPSHHRLVHKPSFIGFEGDIIRFMGTKNDTAMIFSIDAREVTEMVIVGLNGRHTLLTREAFEKTNFCHCEFVPDETRYESCDGLQPALVEALHRNLHERFEEAGSGLDARLALELTRDLIMQVASTVDDLLETEADRYGLDLSVLDGEEEEDEAQTRMEAWL
ncbi:MAG: hypothetical protein Q4Q62_05310 [Thermoplasmata archaeon]|nr:hypothetical protein [Thermoplasmata archaeon]